MPLQGSLQIKSAAHRQALGVCIILVAITWLVFGQTIRYDFVNYDDNEYVYANPAITSGLTLHGITYAFSGRHAKNWHPLTTLSHMLDCQLWGVRAGGHHFTNVVFHTIAVVLLFLVLKQMTGAIWQSAFVAALFAIHPLRVESVAWICERKDVRPLCQVSLVWPLSDGVDLVRARSHVQVNAGDRAFRPVTARLLAAQPLH